MKRKTILKRTPLLAAGFLLGYAIRYCWKSFPIAAGYAAKVLCSALFVGGRKEEEIIADDLNFFPLNLVNCKVNYEESSVTASLFGLASRKAIYRKGLGATLLSEASEAQLRQQSFPAVLPSGTKSIVNETDDLFTGSFPVNINKEQLNKAVENGFKENDPKHLINTRAIVVVYDGRVVAEKYAPGFCVQTRLAGWSMTKSIVSTLTGILVNQNQLSLGQQAPVTEWQGKNDKRRFITIKNLLQQCSGLDFEEEYKTSSDVTRMLYQKADMAAYAASRPLKHPPGSFFYYSSGNTNILSRIIRQTVGAEQYYQFPYEQLFGKLGMKSAVLECDASGTFVGSSYCYATARDWARFGLLYLNNGVCNGERLLPEDWVCKTITPASAALFGEYGFQFWLNAGHKNNPSNRLHPGLPPDMFYARGYEGQNLVIIPSEKLVVVRLGLTREEGFSIDPLLKEIIQSIN